MTQTKKSISFKYKAFFIPLMFAAALLSSCENLISRTPQEITGGGTSDPKIPKAAR